ncbi:MAG: hypothetical protein EXX96DRAFT_577200 [Benjaminiella poitrasii]|nr:MAG: hypothetical protein EXX96DRAFT_577200 [Benjaminiella poitrasii]
MDADGPSGFRNAPVTKFLVPLVGGCSALTYISRTGPGMTLQLSQLTVNGQFWRLFTSHWTFNSIGTTVVGTWLIYKLRIVERRYGSAKYAALIFISFVVSTILQTGALVMGSRSIATGPYAILFSILYQFQKIIPPSYQVKMLGTTMSDKTYTYFAAAQLLLSNSMTSAVPCLCGLAAGALYDTNDNIKQWRFPKWIKTFTSKYILPILNTNNKKKPTRRAAPAVPVHPQPNMKSSSVKKEDIDTMVTMFPTYSRQNIENALMKTKSDLNRAAEILLMEDASSSSNSHSQ